MAQKGRTPDEELVERAREGDPRAMDELVRRHHASAFRIALGILRDEDGAADVAQDAFLKAFRGLGGFRGEASFRTWLLTIARNEARGALRKAVRRKETGTQPGHWPPKKRVPRRPSRPDKNRSE